MQQIPRIAIEAGEQRRIYQVLDDVLTLGDGLDADIRISGAGLETLHLRLVRSDDGFRLECLGPEGSFVHQGEPCRDATLHHGDKVELANVSLTFLLDVPPPRKRPRQEAAAPSRRGASRRVRKRGMPTWALASCLIVSAFAIGALVVNGMGDGSGSRPPADYIELARQQLERGSSAQALSTLALARSRADSEERREIDALERRIRGSLQGRVDQVVIQNGRTDLQSMRNVEQRYLVATPQDRPAARELMRQVAAWEAMYGGDAARLPELAILQSQVRLLEGRYRDVAKMAEADEAADVLFAARWRMRLRPRRLFEALGMVEDWLAAHGDDPEVLDCYEDAKSEAVRMVDARLRMVEILIARDDLQGARSELEELAPLARRFDRGSDVDALQHRLDNQ